MDGWKKYEGRKVFIKLKNGREYSGLILEVESSDGKSLIIVRDKFNKRVSFFTSEISVIEEEGKR